MPNGGSDCCGTCWFNSTHEGDAGLVRNAHEENVRCTIRDLAIAVPFWTYCLNHPHHNPMRLAVPIGPAYRDAGGYPYRREVLAPSPDTEEIRQTLLHLLAEMHEVPRAEYPTSPSLDEAVILQLIEFRDRRAVPDLRRILGFDPLASNSDDPFRADRVRAVGLALQALAAIDGDDCVDTLRAFVSLGLDAGEQHRPYVPDKDRLGFIRHKALESTAYCSATVRQEIARVAVADPDDEIATLARQVLSTADAG